MNEEKAQFLNDPVRIRIIAILRKGIADIITTEEYNSEINEKIIRERAGTRNCLSVSEIVKLSKKMDEGETITRNQVYHHLPKLIEGGYVITYGSTTNGKRTTTYYQRTAKNIIIAAGSQMEADDGYITSESAKFVEKYLKFFKGTFNTKQKEELEKISAKTWSLQLKMIKQFSKQINQDITSPEQIEMLQYLMDIYSLGNPEYIASMQKANQILFPK